MQTPPRTRDLLPSRAGARRNVPALRAGPPDQHRIMNSLCDVDPFRRTPAWPPAQNVRLAHSPHILNLRPPFGLKQNGVLFPRQQATGPGLVGGADALGDASAAPPLPSPFGRPQRKALRADPGQGLQVFGPVRAPPSVFSFSSRGTPAPRFPWAVRIKPAGKLLSFKRTANPSPEAVMPAARHPARQPRRCAQPPCRHSRHAACLCSAESVTASPSS